MRRIGALLAATALACAPVVHAQASLSGIFGTQKLAATGATVVSLGGVTYASNGLTNTLTTAGTVPAGGTVVVAMTQFAGMGAGNTIAETAPGANVYTCRTQTINGNTSAIGLFCYHTYASGLASGATITATFSATGKAANLAAAYVTGVSTYDIDGTLQAATSTANVPVTASTGATTGPGAVFGLFYADSSAGDTETPNGGFTSLSALNTQRTTLWLDYKITIAGAQSYAPQINDAKSYANQFYSFK